MGRNIKTIAITMKTIVSAPCDQYRAVMDMTIPSPKAERKVPRGLPMPPTMTTANASRRTERPMYGWTALMGA